MSLSPKTIRPIAVGPYLIGNQNPLTLIGGPCVIESEQKAMGIAEKLKRITTDLGVPFIFKASYDKANRTSIKSYRGPGLGNGLKILQKIKTATLKNYLKPYLQKKQKKKTKSNLTLLTKQ